jgi:hypothetical protein
MTTERTAKGPAPAPPDRLLNPDGFRHYRRRYSRAELRWGLVTGGILAALGGWVAWKGAHPDPTLLGDVPLPTAGAGRPALEVAAPTAGRGEAAPGAGAASAARGPLPSPLAGEGFREEKVTSFDGETLYVKIDGRADYFKSFGFERLWSALLVAESEPDLTIDVEIYDMGRTANALGAYGGERGAGVKVEVAEAGLSHVDRNALYMVRGRHYVRVIGSEESPRVLAALRGLAERLGGALPGEPLPWAFGLFVGGLGLDPGHVTYFAENAFSFGFAADVWTARPKGKDDDLELFVAARASAADAKAFAKRLQGGFAELGEPGGKAAGGKGLPPVPVIKDPLLGTLTAVGVHDRFVYGARGAADAGALGAALGGLAGALAAAPAALLDRARPAGPAGTGGDDGEH